MNHIRTYHYYWHIFFFSLLVYSALKNRCVSYFRKQQVRDRYQRELLGTASEMGSFWEKVLEEDVYANLMAAIEQLPPQCRLVMQLTL